MRKDQISRFKDAPWLPKEDNNEVIVVGAGGIGSWLTLLLNRVGFVTHVYDFDKYEIHNMGGQLCKESDVNKFKVDALAATVKEFTGADIFKYNEAYSKSSMTHHYAISALDNMTTRKEMFERWAEVNSYNDKALFIDGRLTFEQIQIFCVIGNDLERINKFRTEYLFDDKDVDDAPCTLKQTSHSAAIIAGMMTGFLTNHHSNVLTKDDDRDVPFFTEFLMPINLYQNA